MGRDPATIVTGDAWLHNHLDGYFQWAKTHNSLLIVTFDEESAGGGGMTDPGIGANHIMTLMVGAGIARGAFEEGAGVNHVSMLRTLEDMYDLPHAGAQTALAAAAGFTNTGITDVFVQWRYDADGSWHDKNNWAGGAIPAGEGAVASLLGNIAAEPRSPWISR
jgi:acid phosphatase